MGDKMNELTSTDLRFVVSRIPKDVREIMKNNQIFLAGGFIRAVIAGEAPSDLDLLGPDKMLLENLALTLSQSRQGRVYKTDNAITVLSPPRKPVQFVHRWLYSDAEKLISEFDFTVVQVAVYWEDDQWRSVCSPRFYPDLAARRLTYTHPQRHEDAGGSMLRVIKYVKRGYNIQAPSLAGVVSRLVAGVNLKKEFDGSRAIVSKAFKDGEMGEVVSEHYSRKFLCALLREVDPLTVVDGVEFVDEHEIDQ